jgi:NitT/TauT family transport system substrate-binding protein
VRRHAHDAEVAHPGSDRDFRSKERIVLRELNEAKVRLRLLLAVNLLSKGEEALVQEATELVKIVATIIRNNTLKRRAVITAGGPWDLGFGVWDLGFNVAMTTVQELTKRKHKVAIMNAVHDLPVLVARDLGFFKDEGLDIEFVTTPGMAQVTTSHAVKFDSVFDRPLDSAYNEGGIDQYRMCEWGIMKRAVEANCEGRRGRKIVALGASMSKFAIVTGRDSNIYAPEMLKNKEIAVTPNNGSHFTTLKMMEGFLAPEHVKTTNAGTMVKRLEALKQGTVAAVSLMEPWISVAQQQGLRIVIESHSTRSEAASEELDGPTLAAMFRAQARAVEVLEKDPTPFIHYFVAETGGLLDAKDFQTWRLLHAPPQPYTRERFDDEYNWTVKWNMTVPGATYENTVDNRAWS